MKKSDLKKYKLPNNPGVYFFKQGTKILYIGKATSLSDRTKSYFSKDLIATRGPLIVDMVFKADRIDYEKTDSVLEALILEAALIKKHQPYYNTKEKDDKSWNYVCITDEVLPKVIVVRGKEIDFKNLQTKNYHLKTFFGPFTNGNQLREAMKIIRRIFPYIDLQSAKKDNYEFYKQIGLTPDMDDSQFGKIYQKNIRNLILFFQGKKKQIIVDLKKDMKVLALQKEFERAGAIRNQIFALGHINDIALLTNETIGKRSDLESQKGPILGRSFRIEAYDIAHMSGKNMVGVMTVVSNGEKANSEYRKFIIRTQTNANDTGALEEILSRRFRHTEWGMPDLVVTDGGEAQKRVAERVLLRYQLAIPIVSVVKDDRHKPAKILYTDDKGVHQEVSLKKFPAGKAREILGLQALSSRSDLGNSKGPISSRALESAIILANLEAHRFGITFHKQKRSKNFLNP